MTKQEKTVIIVAAGDVLSVIIKFVLAAMTGSLALSADAWHSLGDLTTSILVFVSLHLDQKELNRVSPDETKKEKVFFRRAGWEMRTSLIISVMLMIVAAGVLDRSIRGTNLGSIKYPVPAIIIVLVLILISYLRFRFESSVGRETESPVLIADAYHSRVDIYVLTLVIISLVSDLVKPRMASGAFQWSLDRWAAIFIGFMILGIAFRIFIRSIQIIFHRSRETQPDERTIEDLFIVVFLGKLSAEHRRVSNYITHKLHLDLPDIRHRIFRVSIVSVLLLGVCAYLFTGFYLVNTQQQAILELFGKPINLKSPIQPGLHYFFPAPFGRVRKVDVLSVRRLRLGYKSTQRKELILWTNVHYIQEYPVLTGDSTFLNVAGTVHYRVSSPAAYLYSTSDPEGFLQTIANGVLRKTMGTREFFSILTDHRREFEEEMLRDMQRSVDTMQLGIEIIHVYFRDIHPPVDVAPTFEDVVSAQEDRETFIEDAIGYKKEQIPEAMGNSRKMIISAQASKNQAIRLAEGKSQAFLELKDEYSRYRDIMRYRLRIEASENALEKVNKYIIDSNSTDHPIGMILGKTGLMMPGFAGAVSDDSSTEKNRVKGGEK